MWLVHGGQEVRRLQAIYNPEYDWCHYWSICHPCIRVGTGTVYRCIYRGINRRIITFQGYKGWVWFRRWPVHQYGNENYFANCHDCSVYYLGSKIRIDVRDGLQPDARPCGERRGISLSKKETFIKGTLILAAAALIARVLGLVQRVPLEHILGDIGNASFTISNTVYLMLLTVATAGIPSTLSKMVSERYALGRAGEAQQIYKAALIFAAVAGVVMSALLWFAAPYYATYVSKVPEAVSAIRALAPALLLFPAIAMMRGYFQGRGNMTAGGISQIVEQFARVGTAIIVAYVMLQWNYDDRTIAAGASFGGVLGSIGAFAVMLYFTLKLRRSDRAAQLEVVRAEQLPMRGIYSDIFKLSIPIVLSSLAVPAINFIDSSLVVPLLSGRIGLEEATGVLAILGAKAQSIAGIPPILAIALSQSLVPVISAAFARKDEAHLQNQITLAMRISILTGMPIVIALCAAAYSVNGLLFSTPDGTPIITLLTFGTIFQITMMTTNSILLG